MKTTTLFSRLVHGRLSIGARRGLFCAVLGAATLAMIGSVTQRHGGFTAHEWGTFTSVQGGDGALLDWRPLETSRLPKFVYDWKNPGLNRRPGGQMPMQKQALLTLQRMETPVIYFYADEEQTVDVAVDFPQGLITEWYPQAAQIGPSYVPAPPLIVKLDQYAHAVGMKPSFTFASLLKNPAAPQSRARWANLEILPAKKSASLSRSLPFDQSGSHYFAARDTDANLLQVDSLVATNPLTEHERFIFYRGVGSFATPLRVTMNGRGEATISNIGTEPLAHLFALGLQNGKGEFVQIERLAGGEARTFPVDAREHSEPIAKLSARLGERMAEALVEEGLYRREATAMINTWKDSWFEEDGWRVLYVLPRAWTDRTLPLKLHPAPRELVRVMVGRAEVLTPPQEQRLTDALLKANQGDEARAQAIAEFKKLGRFAEPALRLATQGSSSQDSQSAWRLLQASVQRVSDWE